MADFDRAVRHVLRHEGGWIDDPLDPGGPTNYGISLRYARAELGDELDLDGDGDVDALDIASLARDRVIGIYRTQWWERYGYGQIRDQAVAAKVFDLAVNVGARQAHRLLQRALVELGHPVAVDGLLGPRTLAAANSADQAHLLTKIVAQQSDFYRNLAARKPQLAKFLPGWLRRAAWPLTERRMA